MSEFMDTLKRTGVVRNTAIVLASAGIVAPSTANASPKLTYGDCMSQVAQNQSEPLAVGPDYFAPGKTEVGPGHEQQDNFVVPEPFQGGFAC